MTVEFHATAELATGGALMRGVVRAFLCQLRIMLIGNGVAFTKNASTRWDATHGAPSARPATRSTACATSTASSAG